MIKVSELINSLKAAYPGYRVRATVRKVCLPRYGYSRWARRITAHDAGLITLDLAAVDYLVKIEEALSETVS